MTINFLPGEPNRYPNSVATTNWEGHRILAYCSGNNVILLEGTSFLIQTIYLKTDGLAVAINNETGWLAISYGSVIKILKPTKRYDKPPKWDELLEFEDNSNHGLITSLSWGQSNELLTGSKYLKLWNVTDRESHILWSRELATQIHTAVFSYDHTLIASIGFNDKTVKIWTRLSFDYDNLNFDFSYLPHGDLVTSIRWRRPFYRTESIENTLFTTCNDNFLRIWQPIDDIDNSDLQLLEAIDLYQNQPISEGSKRFAFILDQGDLSKAIVNVLTRNSGDEKDSGFARITELAKCAPDLCFILDEQNTMSVYAIEGVGNTSSDKTSIHPVATKLKLPRLFPIKSPYLNFFAFYNTSFTDDVYDDQLKDISIIVHDYRGTLLHYTAFLDRMINPELEKKHLSLNSILTGHNKSVQRLLRTANGQSLLSLSRFSENFVWKTHKLEGSVTLKRSSLVRTPSESTVRKATLLFNGDYLFTLLDNEVMLWDCKSFQATSIAQLPLKNTADPMLFLSLPESRSQLKVNGYHIVAIYSDKTGNLWQVKPPLEENSEAVINDLGDFKLPLEDDLLMAIRVDPVGWNAKIGTKLESFNRIIMTTITKSGVFMNWTASLSKGSNSKAKVDWLSLDPIDTGIENAARIEVSSINKVAITSSDSKRLTIWDSKNKILEFEHQFDDIPISDLDWTCTPDNQSILAVGLFSQVILYSQLRFDYTNKTPAWNQIKSIDISMYTSHGIGDSIWLYGGCLAIGAGNQFFIADDEVDISESNLRLMGLTNHPKNKRQTQKIRLFEACTILNGPLPVYHPQFLIQCLFADRLDMVEKILVILLRKIKFGVILDNNVIDISSTLDLDPEDILKLLKEKKEQVGRFSVAGTPLENDDHQPFDQLVAEQLQEWLQKVSLPFMTQHQQGTLLSVIESISHIHENARSLDSNAIKFMLGYRLFVMHRGSQESMSMRDFNWAMHSESQDILVDILKRTLGSATKVLWPFVRDTGMAYWLRTDKLREIFEQLGRNHFIHGERNPIKCTLYYLALKKKQVLLGLWRTASSNKEQVKTIKLLSNDFTTEKWKITASKNAYALMGKHRYEYAASFFLLADALKDAVSVIAKNMGDINLAIAVARVYGGDDHPAFLSLLERFVFPKVVIQGDRWTASWALWKLGDRQTAIQALVKPPREILENYKRINLSSDICRVNDNKSFLVDDPVLIMLYRFLRKQNVKLLIGAAQLSPKEEFNFVLKTASIYRRMGCDILGLSLLTQWSFILDKNLSFGNITPVSSHVMEKMSTEKKSSFGSEHNSILNSRYSILDSAKLKEAVAARRTSSFGGNAAAALAIMKAKAEAEMNGDSAKKEDSTTNTSETEKKDNPFSSFKPAPAVAFQEPDMSAFNFGY